MLYVRIPAIIVKILTAYSKTTFPLSDAKVEKNVPASRLIGVSHEPSITGSDMPRASFKCLSYRSKMNLKRYPLRRSGTARVRS